MNSKAKRQQQNSKQSVAPFAFLFLEGDSSSSDDSSSSSSDELSSPFFLFGAEGAVSIWNRERE